MTEAEKPGDSLLSAMERAGADDMGDEVERKEIKGFQYKVKLEFP